MVQTTISYTTDVTNTGIQNDIIVGCSLISGTGQEIMLPWWALFNIGTGGYVSGLQLSALGDIPAGTYTAITRAWKNRSGGTKVQDIIIDGQVIGAVYQAATGSITGILDEETRSITIS